MDVLPLILLALAVFVVARLVQMALDPRTRQNAAAPVTAPATGPRGPRGG